MRLRRLVLLPACKGEGKCRGLSGCRTWQGLQGVIAAMIR
jgi:hypothetical protein